jgi:hypothetical protein
MQHYIASHSEQLFQHFLSVFLIAAHSELKSLHRIWYIATSENITARKLLSYMSRHPTNLPLAHSAHLSNPNHVQCLSVGLELIVDGRTKTYQIIGQSASPVIQTTQWSRRGGRHDDTKLKQVRKPPKQSLKDSPGMQPDILRNDIRPGMRLVR